MIGDQKENKFVTVATKISRESAETLNRIARSKDMEVYELLQLMCMVLVRATSDKHNLSDEISRLLVLFHSEPGWKNAFNLCNPTAENEIAEEVLILQQQGRKGFGAVKIEKPWMGAWKQTENADEIVSRVLEVCMPGVYRRIRELGAAMGCESLTDLLITLTEAKTILYLEEENRREMMAANNIAENGRPYQYGQRTKIHHHRTPDGEAARQQRIMFDADDRDTAEREALDGEIRQREEPPEDMKPFDVEW